MASMLLTSVLGIAEEVWKSIRGVVSEGPAEGSERKRERESEIERAESDSESKGRGAAAAGQAKIVGGRVIWSGEYTKVAAAWHTEKKRMVALKILNKEFAEKRLLEHFLPREVHSLKVLRHENILEFYEVYDLKQRIIFVMELAENGDLMDYLQYRKMKISEPEARYFFRQIVSAVHYCHSKRFAHRDIKIENFLVTKDMTVKLGDFGYAVDLNQHQPAVTNCGTLAYVAPEVFRTRGEGYDAMRADIWNTGIVLYIMICSKYPFGLGKYAMKSRRVLLFNPCYPSPATKAFIQCMVHEDPCERLSTSDILAHEWMNGDVEKPQSPLCPRYTIKNCLPSSYIKQKRL